MKTVKRIDHYGFVIFQSKEDAEKSLAEAKEEIIKLGSMFQEERDGFVHTESKLQRLKCQFSIFAFVTLSRFY